jgi:hypothetical protein
MGWLHMKRQGGKSLQGTNISSHNSFAALENAEIVEIAGGVGVNIMSEQFELVDLMKDLELARHEIQVTKIHESQSPLDVENVEISEIVNDDSYLPLEWPVDDFETESFTLVESRKKEKVGQSDQRYPY